jgi:transcriptional regulator with XRE-family HTH domain
MIRKSGTKGISPDGPKIRQLRRHAGLSQQEFAARFAVTMRTLQRAESGEPILPEMLNAIAAGLKVSSAELVPGLSRMATSDLRIEPRSERVRLRRTLSARELTAALEHVKELEFEYDVDPDEETAEDLAEATEIVERLAKAAGSSSSQPANFIRRLGRLNGLLARLDECGIAFFVGAYWEPAVTVEDEAGSGGKTQYCRVESVCRGLLRIGRAQGRYQSKLVERTYTDEEISRSVEELQRYGWEVEDLRDSAIQLRAI